MTSLICPNQFCKRLVAVVDRTVETHTLPGSTETCRMSGTHHKPQKVGSKYDGEMGESPVELLELGVATCEHGVSHPAAKVRVNREWLIEQLAISQAETDPSKVN